MMKPLANASSGVERRVGDGRVDLTNVQSKAI
jgi:hypothetical protein